MEEIKIPVYDMTGSNIIGASGEKEIHANDYVHKGTRVIIANGNGVLLRDGSDPSCPAMQGMAFRGHPDVDEAYDQTASRIVGSRVKPVLLCTYMGLDPKESENVEVLVAGSDMPGEYVPAGELEQRMREKGMAIPLILHMFLDKYASRIEEIARDM